MPVLEDVEVVDLEQLLSEDLHCTVPHDPNRCTINADYELRFHCGRPSYYSCDSFRKLALQQGVVERAGVRVWTCSSCEADVIDCFYFLPI